jgi:O-succinylbenzoic acid--CoA ligase
MVATQLRRVLQDDDTPPPSLRAALLGGSALPASLTDWAHERGWSIHTSYGMTEMASQVATTPPGASAQTLRTSGRVLPHRTCTIAPDGEILVRGPTLLEGYVTKEGRNDPRDADGWYHTGDVGRIDSDGLLHVEGRQDRMFVSGGENIQPEAIERVLTRHDDVLQAAVVPVPDETYGQRPVAFVRSRARSEEDRVPEALQEVLRDSLAAELPRFMVPDAFYPWPAEHRRRAPSDSPGDTSGEGAEPNPDGVQDQLKVDRERLKEEARRRRADETD